MTSPTGARSYLYVPGDRPDRLALADRRGADAVIADLEDSVAPGSRADALLGVAAFLAQDGFAAQRWVRVEPSAGLDQLSAAVQPSLTGIVLPKAEPESLTALHDALSRCELVAGVPVGSTVVLALVESARGLRRLDEIAAAPRVVRLGLGEADLRAELGIDPSPDARELLPLRLAVVVASAAAAIAPPVAPASTDFRDLEALRESTAALARLGFRARTSIHPAQVPVINAAFTPTADQVERALDVVAVYEAALAQGRGAAVARDGRMVDLAVVRWARDVLSRRASPDDGA